MAVLLLSVLCALGLLAADGCIASVKVVRLGIWKFCLSMCLVCCKSVFSRQVRLWHGAVLKMGHNYSSSDHRYAAATIWLLGWCDWLFFAELCSLTCLLAA